MKKIELLLDYAASHLEVIVTCRASDMVQTLHSDVSYLSKPKARIRAGGHFFLSENDEDPASNGAVLNTVQLINAIMSSAAKAKMGDMFMNAQEAVPYRKTLQEISQTPPCKLITARLLGKPTRTFNQGE